jgi:nitrilase
LNPTQTVNVSVVQDAPVLFQLAQTIEKIGDLTQKATNQQTDLVLFPEAFIPAYPRGLGFGMVVGSRNDSGRDLWQKYWENAVLLDSPEVNLLCKIARQNNVFLSVGLIEKDAVSANTLFCTQIYIDKTGTIAGVHRKLKPTGSERLIWGEGDGSTLTVVDSGFGKVGGLICWENYMPLARMAIYGKGVQIYLAPTADSRENWQATLKHIACEGRCFVLGCNQYVTKSMYPEDLPMLDELTPMDDLMCLGGSAILSPMGEVLAGPLFGKAGILEAELDMDLIIKAKMDFDVTGHYARPDIFQLIVNESTQKTVRYQSDIKDTDR